MKRPKLFTSWLPGVVLVGERYCANALADKVNWERHREESLHRARVEVQLLERNKIVWISFHPDTREKFSNKCKKTANKDRTISPVAHKH